MTGTSHISSAAAQAAEEALRRFRQHDDLGALDQIDQIPWLLRNDALVRLLCEVLHHTGAHAEAIAEAERRLQREPIDALTRTWLITTHLTHHRAEEAARWAEPLEKLGDDPALLVASLAARGHQGVAALCGLSASHTTLTLRLVSRSPLTALGEACWSGAQGPKTCLKLTTAPVLPGLCAATLALDWPGAATGVTVDFGPNVRCARDGQAARPLSGAGLPLPLAAAAAVPIDHVTLIIPVHGAIRDALGCLESVARDKPQRVRRTVMVMDDATPDHADREALALAAQRHGFQYQRHDQACGYVTTVNRALLAAPPGAACLLNSDTLVPIGFLDRMVAHAARDVATVTPLSNNGELTSWPAPFRANPMPSPEEAAVIDAAARALHLGALPLPNGIGFCLLLTPWALAVGGLFDDARYGDGYLEEVAYCGMLSRAGFRHVCALDVFVAHRGGASFGARRAELIARHRRSLLARDTEIAGATERFVRDDPLAPARVALQRRMRDHAPTAPPTGTRERLFGADPTPQRAVVVQREDRAKAAEGQMRVVALVVPEAGAAGVALLRAIITQGEAAGSCLRFVVLGGPALPDGLEFRGSVTIAAEPQEGFSARHLSARQFALSLLVGAEGLERSRATPVIARLPGLIVTPHPALALTAGIPAAAVHGVSGHANGIAEQLMVLAGAAAATQAARAIHAPR